MYALIRTTKNNIIIRELPFSKYNVCVLRDEDMKLVKMRDIDSLRFCLRLTHTLPVTKIVRGNFNRAYQVARKLIKKEREGSSEK